MANPNLFKIQENPDGIEGHIERENLRNKIDLEDEIANETQFTRKNKISRKLHMRFNKNGVWRD